MVIVDSLDAPMLVFDVSKADLKMYELKEPIQALPGGGALFVGVKFDYRDYKYHVIRLDNTGCVIETITVIPDNITGLILMESDVLLLHDESVTRVRIRDGEVVNRYKVRGVRGCLRSGLVLDEDDILMLDDGNLTQSDGQVFTDCLNHRHTEDHLNNLNYPKSVNSIRIYKDKLFAVCESGSNKVSLYNSKWRLHISITETPDGPLSHPTCVIELPSEPASVLIADCNNHRLSQFTIYGRFIKHNVREKTV